MQCSGCCGGITETPVESAAGSVLQHGVGFPDAARPSATAVSVTRRGILESFRLWSCTLPLKLGERGANIPSLLDPQFVACERALNWRWHPAGRMWKRVPDRPRAGRCTGEVNAAGAARGAGSPGSQLSASSFSQKRAWTTVVVAWLHWAVSSVNGGPYRSPNHVAGWTAPSGVSIPCRQASSTGSVLGGFGWRNGEASGRSLGPGRWYQRRRRRVVLADVDARRGPLSNSEMGVDLVPAYRMRSQGTTGLQSGLGVRVGPACAHGGREHRQRLSSR